jgi:hypothetical protein
MTLAAALSCSLRVLTALKRNARYPQTTRLGDERKGSDDLMEGREQLCEAHERKSLISVTVKDSCLRTLER